MENSSHSTDSLIVPSFRAAATRCTHSHVPLRLRFIAIFRCLTGVVGPFVYIYIWSQPGACVVPIWNLQNYIFVCANKRLHFKLNMGSEQAQRLQALMDAKKQHDEALDTIRKCMDAGVLTPGEAEAQQAQANATFQRARAEAGLAGRDDQEESKNEGDKQEGKPKGEGGGSKRGRQPGQKIGKYAARTRIDDLGINTLREVCADLGLPNRQINEKEMTASIHKASGATAKVLKTNLEALSVETLKHICADRKLKIENESDKTALIDWIQNGAASVHQVGKLQEVTPPEEIHQPPQLQAQKRGRQVGVRGCMCVPRSAHVCMGIRG